MRICRNTCPFRAKTRRCKSVLPARQARQDAAKPGFRIALPVRTNRGANFRNQPKGGLERENPQFRRGFPASREEIAEPAAPGRQKRRKRMVFSNRSYSACAQAKPLGFSGHDACQGSAASASSRRISPAQAALPAHSRSDRRPGACLKRETLPFAGFLRSFQQRAPLKGRVKNSQRCNGQGGSESAPPKVCKPRRVFEKEKICHFEGILRLFL